MSQKIKIKQTLSAAKSVAHNVAQPKVAALHLGIGTSGIAIDVLSNNNRLDPAVIFNLGVAALYLTVDYFKEEPDWAPPAGATDALREPAAADTDLVAPAETFDRSSYAPVEPLHPNAIDHA